ncbi:MAG TPA: acyltransferase family protein [Mesorhizobium sp.]|jgi:peptidoglycan/LPS O-acetylase OafA/YrhL|nr:acyltransferase family protein [Mesorhizobium sp.]
MTDGKTQRLLNLDLLRLASALLVVLFHFGFRMGITGEGGGTGFPELAPFAMWGHVGLLIFFAISGYVIAMSAENRSAFDFAVGRTARLWPTFVVCASVTALVLLWWPVAGIAPPTFAQWLAHLAIVSRALGQPFLDGAYWTIVYEIVFYAWVFLLMATGLFHKHWRMAVLAWLALSILNEGLIDSGAVRKLFITEYSGFFAFGLVLFKLQRDFSRADLPLLALAAFWACLEPWLVEPFFVEEYGVRHSFGALALTGSFALSVMTLAALAPSAPLPPRLAAGLGALTYPLYLLHQHIGYAAFAHFGGVANRWLVAVLLLAALLLAAAAIARWIEPSGKRLIQRAAKPFRGRLPLFLSARRPATP